MTPLVPLHNDESLIPLKLAQLVTVPTLDLIDSLMPGRASSLKARPDGTILDGHHRLKILRDRGVDIHNLPQEVIEKHAIDGS